jgi:hypothetical protein
MPVTGETRDNPATAMRPGGWPYMWCKCALCELVAICTPDFDFYGTSGLPLVCEDCFGKSLAEEGIHKFVRVNSPPPLPLPPEKRN